MVKALQRPTSWAGKVLLLAIAVLAIEIGHAGGVETRAWGQNVGAALAGSVLGIAMVAMVLARLFGKNVGLIRSDVGAVGALLFMVVIKVAIAQIFQLS